MFLIKRLALALVDLLRWCIKRWIKEDEKPAPIPDPGDNEFDDRWDESGG